MIQTELTGNTIAIVLARFKMTTNPLHVNVDVSDCQLSPLVFPTENEEERQSEKNYSQAVALI